MKTNIIGIMIALVLAFAAAVGAWAQDEKVSEVRKVDDFSSIRITSVANVIFTQGERRATGIRSAWRARRNG